MKKYTIYINLHHFNFNQRITILFFALFLSSSVLVKTQNRSMGVNAAPSSITVKQPDNTTITIIGKGTRYIHWTETTDGYSIIRNAKKIYEYALKNEKTGKLIATTVKANDPNKRRRKEKRFIKKKLTPHIKPNFKTDKKQLMN